MTPQTLPDVVPDGATVAITSAENLSGVWVTIAAPSTNAAVLRAGDASTGSARGASISPGQSLTFQRGGFDQQSYRLKSIFVYGSSNDVATITYGN